MTVGAVGVVLALTALVPGALGVLLVLGLDAHGLPLLLPLFPPAVVLDARVFSQLYPLFL